MANTNTTTATHGASALELALQAEISKLQAQLAEGSGPMKIEAAIATYGKGTISLRGINRFPISLFPTQIDKVRDYMNSDEFKQFVSSPDTLNKLRCAAVAAEACQKLGKKWSQGAKDTDQSVIDYKATYDQFYAEALKNPQMVPSGRVKSSTAKNSTVVR